MGRQTGRGLLAGVVGIGTVVALSMVTPSHAQAAATCLGLTATVTAPPGAAEVRGTEGDDVIVAEGGSPRVRVSALGGDDAVCVTGPAAIDAGEGNDRVQSRSEPSTRNLVVLGSGSDLFEGSDGNDRVYTERTETDPDDGSEQPSPGTGTENVDVVHTYGGDDKVSSGARWDNQANEDEVDLGSGDDLVWLTAWLGGAAKVSGGTGTDLIYVQQLAPRAETLTIDLSAETATANGVQFSTVEGFENVAAFQVADFQNLDDHGSGSLVEVRGSDGPNRIIVTNRGGAVGIDAGDGDDELFASAGFDSVGAYGTSGVTIDAGNGDDDVAAYAGRGPEGAGRLDVQSGAGGDSLELYGDPESVLGGPGRDTVDIGDYAYGDAEDEPVVYDLARGVFSRGDVTAPFETEKLALYDIRHGRVHGDVRVLGTGGRDVITAAGCGTVVRGAGGNDLLRSLSEKCEGAETTLYGDSGDDVLRGGDARDVLLGGTGSDRAFGGAGVDRCRAEFERDCEGS